MGKVKNVIYIEMSNRQVVPMKKLAEYNELVNKCKKIYMRFFYGDDLTELEKDIETRYLVNKQGKYLKYLATEVELKN